jgi:prevent-host-death family protein
MAKTTQANSKWPATGPVPASKAKAHFLELISAVDKNGTELIITKRGKPVAKLVPFRKEKSADSIFGCMKGTFEITGDIIGPEPDVWDAMR